MRLPLSIDRSSTIAIPVLVSICMSAACMLWFMDQAVRNEKLAAQERLGRAYRISLTATARAFESRWEDRLRAVDAVDFDRDGQMVFKEVALLSPGQSVVVLDETGAAAYPSPAARTSSSTPSYPDRWDLARNQEFQLQDPGSAAQTYAWLAEREPEPDLAARALLGRARCLTRTGDETTALEILTGDLQSERFSESVDAQGRLIPANALMLAVGSAESKAPVTALTAMLNDYQTVRMPASQRAYLMRSLVTDGLVGPEAFPSLEAEQLAARFLDQQTTHLRSVLGMTLGQWTRVLQDRSGPGLSAGSSREMWWTLSDTGLGILLFESRTIQETFAGVVADVIQDDGLRVTLGPPDDVTEAFDSVPLTGSLSGWQVRLHLEQPDRFAEAAGEQTVLYVWAGSLSIVAMLAAALYSVRSIRRQARLARLKNDLVATVSHELKTPIASVKVLVDTLLDRPEQDPGQTAEYLELISTENERLARLVENFLTFSRIERGEEAYETAPSDPEDLVREALAPMQERLSEADFHVDIRVDDDVREVVVDRNALVTALSNLLENAFKFSKDSRQIAVHVTRRDDLTCFAVSDRGIGMSKRDARRVFDRFYQADTRLARESSGVGLGLSIVKAVAEGHGGGVRVESEPGKGSTFEISLPSG